MPPFIKTGSFSVGGVKFGQITNGQPTKAVDFDRPGFDSLLGDKGYDVTWEKASLCPNRPKDSLSPLGHHLSCPFCDNTGFIYFDALKTEMLVQSIGISENFQAAGEWSTGRVSITARPDCRISYWDRITLNHGMVRFPELVKRQNSGPDYPKYKPICIEYAAWVNRAGQLIRLNSNNIFIDDDGTLVWSGEQPDGDSYYTISYTFRPRFVIQDMPHQLRESTVDSKQLAFSVQGTGRADFLVRDESRDAPVMTDANPFPKRR